MIKKFIFSKKGASVCLATALFLIPAISTATEVYIDITRKRSERIKIAIPPYALKQTVEPSAAGRPLGALAKEVMEFDLQFSGYFGVLKDDSVIDEITRREAKSSKTEWGLWKQSGANLLVKGAYSIGPGGSVVMENSLSDVERTEQIAGVRYSGTKDLFRKMIHKFADQIVYRFTGEPGIADTRISFSSKGDKGKELYVCDYDGQNVKTLTRMKSIIISPRWSPSAAELVFTSFHNRNPAAYVLDLRTGVVRPVAPGMRNTTSAAAWSPDGKKIVFAMSIKGVFDIYTISASGAGMNKLTSSDSIETSPSYSPDGKSIVFVSDRPGKPQLYIMDADGGNPRRFTYNGDYNADPVWSPKGDKIAYAAFLGDNFNIMVKSLDGSIEKQLTANAGKNESPSWSPDGRHIVFTSTRTGTRQVFIMNANGENQMQITNMAQGAYGASWSPRQ